MEAFLQQARTATAAPGADHKILRAFNALIETRLSEAKEKAKSSAPNPATAARS